VIGLRDEAVLWFDYDRAVGLCATSGSAHGGLTLPRCW
jgi:hypothetical protein